LTPLLAAGQKPPRNFNLGNKDVRKLYTKLTGDAIDTAPDIAPVWARFETHVVRRHKVVHHGHRVSAADAQDSLAVATEVINHVEKV
jgi:hypothetical protein